MTLQLQVKDSGGATTATESELFTTNGATAISFNSVVPYKGSYAVTVTTQPTGQTCSIVTGGSGSNVQANVTNLAVNCATNTYTITSTTFPASGAKGNISPAGVTTVNFGGSQHYVITAALGYQIVGVRVDGVLMSPTTSYPFDNVTANHTIEAIFIGVVGELMCQPSPPFAFDASDGSVTSSTGMMVPGYAVGQRGPNNKDGGDLLPGRLQVHERNRHQAAGEAVVGHDVPAWSGVPVHGDLEAPVG